MSCQFSTFVWYYLLCPSLFWAAMFAVIPKFQLSFNGHTWPRLHLHRQNNNRFWFLHVLGCSATVGYFSLIEKEEQLLKEWVNFLAGKQMGDMNLQWHPLGLIATWFLISICFWPLFALTSICFDTPLLWHPTVLRFRSTEGWTSKLVPSTIGYLKQPGLCYNQQDLIWYPQIIRDN